MSRTRFQTIAPLVDAKRVAAMDVIVDHRRQEIVAPT